MFASFRTAGVFPGGLFLFAAAVLLMNAGVTGAAQPPHGSLSDLRFLDETAPIEASLYSLPSNFFAPADAARFLAAVRANAPRRWLGAVCDPSMCSALAAEASRSKIELLPTSEAFSPWPRDPFLFARTTDDNVVLVGRANLQSGREADGGLAPFLAGALAGGPWRAPRFAESPLPFHGGQMLQAGETLWLSLHGVEPRALALLGLERVPVESFAEPAGFARYAAAVRRAGAELAALVGRTAEFVHPLPADERDTAAPMLARQLGGGAGLDLDSYLTLVPRAGRLPVALVAEPRFGSRLLETAGASELTAFSKTYELALEGEALRRALLEAQAEPRSEALAAYLELITRHLERRGLEVRRLPLLRVPTALLADRRGVSHREFLLGWNNVVLDGGGQGVRAEGFASGLAAGDAAARQAFSEAGVDLSLLPPLVHSVVLNGGYRCASNHLRRRP